LQNKQKGLEKVCFTISTTKKDFLLTMAEGSWQSELDDAIDKVSEKRFVMMIFGRFEFFNS
jgi:hypothetical protein